MNNLPRTWLTAVALATTLSAQATTPQQALARAQVIEMQEHDLAAAQQAYRALLADEKAADVHAIAALRLGTSLWRLDQKDAAKAFLDRAIAAGGDTATQATAILQGQGEDAKLAQERLTKARALVGLYAQVQGGGRNPGDGGLIDDPGERRSLTILAELRPLGAQAAEAIAEFLEIGLRTGRIAKYPGQDPVRPRLMCLLWEIGTQPAMISLRRWSEPEDLNVRLGAAEGCKATTVAADLEPVLFSYVRDPDPSGEVWRLVVNAVVRMPHERHVELLAADDAPTRAAALHALAATWRELGPQQQEQLVERHGAAIRRATRDADTRVVATAWRLLHRFAGGPTNATLLFFAEADRYPGEMGRVDVSSSIVADDTWLHALTEGARRIAASPHREDASALLVNLLRNVSHKWTRASVDDVLALLELGYRASGWEIPFVQMASDEQLARLITLLPGHGTAGWIKELRSRDLPASVFPQLRAVLEQCFAGARFAWDDQPDTSTRVVRGRRISVRNPDPDTLDLLWCAAVTGNPDAATWLVALVDTQPRFTGTCAKLLIEMSVAGVGEPAHAGMRKLLTWEGTDADELQPAERSLLFAELARAGDVAAIPLFPRAYELGLARVRSHRPLPKTATRHQEAAGIGFLVDVQSGERRRDTSPWHGYRDADLLTAWRTLLDAPRLDRVLADFSGYLDPMLGADATRGQPTPNIGSPLIPIVVLPLVCERLPALLGAAGERAENDIVNRLDSALGRVAPADVKAGSALRLALTALFRDATPRTAALFHSLPEDVRRDFATEGRALHRRFPGHVHLAGLRQAGIELTDEDWQTALSGDDGARYQALETVPAELGAPLRAAIESNLTHEDLNVRKRAIDAVQRLYGPNGVASLLPLLQDHAPEVREHVRKALDMLRQDAEQRAFWSQAGSGIDTSQRGAASKLLAQAKAGEPKDQRVLALRSLAVLGAAESLPYLIDATKDQDAEIAAAAREAIATIHTKSGAPVPANK